MSDQPISQGARKTLFDARHYDEFEMERSGPEFIELLEHGLIRVVQEHADFVDVQITWEGMCYIEDMRGEAQS